jgi:vacuolar-type H+-ATPase subunit I/STV1
MLLDEGKEIKYDENIEFSVSQESENESQELEEINDEENECQELKENNNDEDIEDVENSETFVERLILTKEEQNEKIIENINDFLKFSNDVFIVILFYIGFLLFIQEILSYK